MKTGMSDSLFRAVAVLAVLVTGAAASSGRDSTQAAAETRFDFLHVSLADLREGKPETLERVKEAATKHGIFAVVDSAPQGMQAEALSAFAECVQSEEVESVSKTVLLGDNSKRTTLATTTIGRKPQPFHDQVQGHCPEFSSAASGLRKAVDDTVQAYAEALDKLALNLQPEAQPFDQFSKATASAESLEHFHLFRREAAPPQGSSALDMHTDMGLFIVMTPATYLPLLGSPTASEAAHHSSGLKVRLADGTVAEGHFQPGSLIVMNGEGSNRWMNNPMGGMLLPPEHEVSFPFEEGVGRVWFGRMVLPAGDAVMQGSDLTGKQRTTFREYRSQAHSAFKLGQPDKAMSAGCLPAPAASHAHAAERRHMRHLLADEHSCEGEDEVYCWMACRSTENITDCSIEEVVCLNLDTLEPWEDGVHCRECGLTCPTDVATPAPTEATTDSAARALSLSSPAVLLAAALGLAVCAHDLLHALL